MKCFVSIYVFKPFKLIQSFLRDSNLKNWAYRLDDWSRRYILIRRNGLWRQQSGKKIVGITGTILFQISGYLFLSTFSSCWFSWLLLENSPLENFVTNLNFGWKFCVVQQDTFYSYQEYEKGSFYNKSRLHINGRSVREGKNTTYLLLAQNWKLLTSIWQKLLFISTHSATLRRDAKRDWKSRICSKCKLCV